MLQRRRRETDYPDHRYYYYYRTYPAVYPGIGTCIYFRSLPVPLSLALSRSLSRARSVSTSSVCRASSPSLPSPSLSRTDVAGRMCVRLLQCIEYTYLSNENNNTIVLPSTPRSG